MKHLHDNSKLIGNYLDYGCGKGFDAIELGMDRYDPHFTHGRILCGEEAFKMPEMFGMYYTITCNYVLNVIDSEEERGQVLKNIQNLLMEGGKAYITVRRDIKKEGYTSKGTFQKNIILDLPILKETKNGFCIYILKK
jgi:hypothetical protein